MIAGGAFAGLGLDRMLGEPTDVVHPVARFGAAMTVAERRLYAPRRANGVVYLALGASTALGAGLFARRALGAFWSSAIACGLCSAARMLEREARAVAQALHGGDLELGRTRIGRLVGRRVDRLDAPGIARAAVETVAENTVDAVVATVFWTACAGAPGAFVHRAVNTMDAMVGHRSPRYREFGWASARLDDALNWVPARLTVLAVAIVRPRRARAVSVTVRRDAGRHPSPNGGVAEAAFAAALGVVLGGENEYDGSIEDRGTLGSGRAADIGDIERANALARTVGLTVGAFAVVGEIIGLSLWRRLWRRPG